MKKTLSLLLTCVLLLSLAACTPQAQPAATAAPTAAPTPSEAPPPAATPAPVESMFTPGTVAVETMGHNGPLSVSVTFDENAITDIAITAHSESRSLGDTAMEIVKNDILQYQTLGVDMVSGATVSGAVLRAAVSSAIEQAGGNPNDFQTPAAYPAETYADVECDVVIVGSGSAGVAAMAEAVDIGLNAILVEQLGQIGGSSVRAGYMIGGGTKLQAEQGVSMTSDEYVNMFNVDRSPAVVMPYDSDRSVLIMSQFGGNIDWLQEKGVEFGPVIQGYQHYGPNGERIGGFVMDGMQKYLDSKGADIRLNTRATEIIMQDGKAAGVKVVAKDGTEYNIHAGAVILAGGGYFASQDMVAKYNPTFVGYPTDVSTGSDGSTMQMGEQAGGVLQYMDQANYHGLATMWNGASRSLTLPAGNGCIAVNTAGKRFVNEAGSYETLTKMVMEQTDGAFCIMDQQMMELDNIKSDIGLSCILEMYTVADTPEQLAEMLGIDPAGLAATIATYSADVQNEKDTEFDKQETAMRSDFTQPPYYGVKAAVETHTVHGGLIVDNDTHVLNADGEIIPGLFAAGECALTPIQGNATNSVCMVMGRTAARVVLAEK